jgi:NDP-sugar pyrophosphorylase family protein
MSDICAIILCGGKGERLRPFTETLPKPLIPINGHPLLYHLLSYLFANKVGSAVLCTGFKAESIESFLREQRRPDWNVACVNSGEVSMTDRILDASRRSHGPYLICYGDTLANVDVGELSKTHLESGALATVTVYPMHSPFGIVSFDGSNRVDSFAEKPVLPYWINIGFLVCEPGALRYIERGSDMPQFLSALAGSRELAVFRHEGNHLTVNTEKDRAEAEAQGIEFFTLIES